MLFVSEVIQQSLHIQGCFVKEIVLSGTEQAFAKLEVSVMWYVCY